MSKTIVITGAGGFIGKALVSALHHKGYRVIALVHSVPAEKTREVQYHEYELGSPLGKEIFTGVDVCIHLAFRLKAPSPNEQDVNIYAARQLKSLVLPRYIFFSSFAAAPPVTPSYYGQCKSALEDIFADDLIIRPALVLGEGGLFTRIKKQLRRSRIIPLLKGGRQQLQVIALENLVETVIQMMEAGTKGIYHLAHPKPVAYKEFIRLVAAKESVKPLFLPLPVWIVKMILRLTSIFKHNISKDNLQGLLASKYIDTASEENPAGSDWRSAEDILRLILFF